MRRLLAELCAEGNLAKLESERVLLQGAVDFLSQIQVEVAHIHRQVVIRGQGKLIKPHPFRSLVQDGSCVGLYINDDTGLVARKPH